MGLLFAALLREEEMVACPQTTITPPSLTRLNAFVSVVGVPEESPFPVPSSLANTTLVLDTSPKRGRMDANILSSNAPGA